MLDCGFEHFPEADKAVWYHKGIAGFEGAALSGIADEPQVSLDDVAELILSGERSPFSRRAFPCSSAETAVRAFKIGTCRVARCAFDHAGGVLCRMLLADRCIGETGHG